MSIRVSVNRVDLDDKTLQKPVLKDYGETRTAENSGASYTVDLTRGNVYELTLTANCTLTFSNPPTSGIAGSFTLILKQDSTGSRSVVWPTSVNWEDAIAPTLTAGANSIDITTFITTDGGTNWYGFLGGTNFA